MCLQRWTGREVALAAGTCAWRPLPTPQPRPHLPGNGECPHLVADAAEFLARLVAEAGRPGDSLRLHHELGECAAAWRRHVRVRLVDRVAVRLFKRHDAITLALQQFEEMRQDVRAE